MFPIDVERADSVNNIFCRKPESRRNKGFSFFHRANILLTPGKKLIIAGGVIDSKITAGPDGRLFICCIDDGFCSHLCDVIANYFKRHYSSSSIDSIIIY